jgi:intracellular sulfur oxidation DsrE/DsrF family protein
MKHTALLPMVVFWAGLAVSAAAAEKEVIPIQVRKDLQLVYQVTDDLVYEGVNKGLFYTKKLIDTYERQGINLTDVNMHVVYHGTGLAALVNDGARDRLGVKTTNPNRELLAELIKRGVKVELCENTMRTQGVKPEEVLAGVSLVVGAYPRLVDLQLLGCAYIKFE